MKKILLSALTALCAFAVGAAKEHTFTVATINVDGMPPKILTFTLNPDAKEGPGAKAIGEGILRNGWDIIALSEDFNYHNDLMEPLWDYYFCGTHRGKLYSKLDVLTNPFDTDGLGLLWNKSVYTSQEAWYEWWDKYGKTSNGSDQLIRKGYRYYLVELAPGMMVDLYIHHMDAEDSPEDNAARAKEISQLVQHIKSTHNKRPILIMGDTNCRYTRDDLKNLLYGALQEDGRFTVGDPWIDFYWGGNYNAKALEVGSSPILTDNYGFQKGEVVDKIFYINDAECPQIKLVPKAYHQADEFKDENGQPLSDHYPVTATFALVTEDSGPIVGAPYVFRNRATGKYINQGTSWGTHSVAEEYGMVIRAEETGVDKQFKLHTSAGYFKADMYVDGPEADAATFTILPVPNEEGYYTLTMGGNNLATGGPNNELITVAPNAASAVQQWEMLTFDDLRKELAAATPAKPMDATSFIRCNNFSRNDDKSVWTIYKQSKVTVNFNGPETNNILSVPTWKKSWNASSDSEFNIWQTINVPNGRYRLTFQGFSSVPASAKVMAGDKEIYLQGYSSSSEDAVAAANAFSNGEYLTTIDDILVTNNSMSISVYKYTNSGDTWTAVDNFRLTYYGPTEDMNVAYDRVKNAMDDVQAKLSTIEPAAAKTFNNTTVEQAYSKQRLTADGKKEVTLTYQALANATKNQSKVGANMTYAIFNNSFEIAAHGLTGFEGWEYNGAGDTQVLNPNTDANKGVFEVNPVDGNYVFNTWDNGVGHAIAQNLPGMPAGLYRLEAKVASDAGNNFFLEAAGTHSAPIVTTNKTQFVEGSHEFFFGGGVMRIGLKSSPSADYDANNEGSWYKVDDFRLTYLSTDAYVKLQRVIDDCKQKGEAAGAAPDFTDVQEKVNTRSVQTEEDFLTSSMDAFTALSNGVKMLVAPGQDMTYAIINPSFESPALGLTGFEGWSYSEGGDTRVVDPNLPENTELYGCSPVDGSYVFNTWDDGVGPALSQTIKGMPAGEYRLTARIASDLDNYYFLEAAGTHSEPIATVGKTSFVDGSLDFKFAGGRMRLGVKSNPTAIYDSTQDGAWYKADNFHLTYVKPYSGLSVTASYDPVKRSLKLASNPSSGSITIRYCLVEEGSLPVATAINQTYKSSIDLSAWDGRAVDVWATASGVGFETLEPTKIISQFVGEVSALESIDATAEVEYYNLQGLRVDNPTHGIYIRRQGNTVSKVIL